MNRLALSLWGALFLSASAHAQSVQLIINDSNAVSQYTGPGDVVTAPTMCYSVRACTAATRGNAVMNVCNVSDVACVDFVTNVITGDLVVTTVGGSDCSSVTCTIKTWYDQGSAGTNATNATIGNRPQFIVSCVNSKPCAQFVRASSQKLTNGYGGTTSQPFSISAVMIRTGSNTSEHDVSVSASAIWLYFKAATNSVSIERSPLNITGTLTDNTWGSVQSLYNGATPNSNIYVNGTQTTGSVTGTSVTSSGITIGCGNSCSSTGLQGKVTELIWYTTHGFSNTEETNMCQNQQAYFGAGNFSAAC